MALDLLKDRGISLEQQRFTWKRTGPAALQQAGRRRLHPRARDLDERDRVGGATLLPRLRAHEPRPAAAAGAGAPSRAAPADAGELAQSGRSVALETTIGFEQVAIEVTASIAERERTPPGAGLPLRAARRLRPHVPV